MSQTFRTDAATAPRLESPEATTNGWRAKLPDVAGVVWVMAAAVIYVLPELLRSVYPGFTWDQFTELVPWSTLTWSQVHHLHLPLWNPYSGLGMPLAFNWQSAPLSLTSLVGYLLPEHWVYTNAVLLTEVIAGTGAYVFGRVLRLGVVGSAMAGTVFVLSGPFVWLLNWPAATVASWLGWLFAGIVLVLRGGRHRVWSVVFLAIIVAQTVYAGQLDMLGIVSIATAFFVAAMIILRILKDGVRAQLRPAGAVAISIAAGAALSAPLLLPGLQLAAGSAHVNNVQSGILTPEATLNIVFSAVPFTIGGVPFTAAVSCYVGSIAVGMALLGVITCWRRAEVRALCVVSLLLVCLAFAPVAYSWLEHLPMGRSVQWLRLIVPLSFGLAMLAGVGVDQLARRPFHNRLPELLTGIFVGGTALFGVAWALTSTPFSAVVRTQAFLWFVVSVVAGTAVGVALIYGRAFSRRADRPMMLRTPLRRVSAVMSRWLGRGWWAAVILLAFESTFLLVAGSPNMESITSSKNVVSPSDKMLAEKASTSLVGFSTNACDNSLPIAPELNSELNVRELPAYDPMMPNSYFTVWRTVSGASAKPSDVFLPGTTFCPAITSARMARLFGVDLVVTPHGEPGPSGTVFSSTVGDVDLYRVPGAALATVSRLGPNGALPSPTAADRPVPATQPYPGALRIETNQTIETVLRIRLTDVPGWHATIDGRPLALMSFDKLMFQARVPPGRHTIILTYWPTTFTLGLFLAGVAVVGLVAALVIDRRRRSRTSATVGGTTSPLSLTADGPRDSADQEKSP